MIDYVITIYRNYDLAGLQLYNFRKRFPAGDYKLHFIDNTPNSQKKIIENQYDCVYHFCDNPYVNEFDGESHGRAIDFGVNVATSDIVCVLDSDFFILNDNIHSYVYKHFNDGFKAVGAEYNDGAATSNWVNKNPKSFENIPCCFGSYYSKDLAKVDTWKITSAECEAGKSQGYVEVGCKIRKHIYENKIKTKSWSLSRVYNKMCYFADNNDIMGIHYVAGSHAHWNQSSDQELRSIL